MEQIPLVSIIMPVYNAREYLHQSIGSILAQTCGDFELILIDDGSRDDSLEICRKYAEADSRIRVLHKENGGPGAARNFGLDRARGEYILFVDSDDTVEARCLEVTVGLAQQHQAEAVFYNFDILTPEGRILESGQEHPIRDGLYTPDEVFGLTYEKNGYVFSLLCDKLLKRSCFENLRFLPLRMCEDEVLFPRLLARCDRVCMTEQILYHYYHRSGSVMHQSFGTRNMDQLYAYFDRFQFYLQTDRRELSHIAGRTYWDNLRQHCIKYDLKDRALGREWQSAKKQFNSVLFHLWRNPQITWKDKLQQILFFFSPSAFKRYIQYRSK